MGRYPGWEEKVMRRITQRRLIALGLLILLLWIALVAWIFWLAPLPDRAEPIPQTELASLLATLTIVAVLIERVLETLFRIVQGSWPQGVAYYSHGLRWLKATLQEEAEAREWLQNVSTFYNRTRETYNQQLRDLLAKFADDEALTAAPEQAYAALDALKQEADLKLRMLKTMVDEAAQRLDEAETKFDAMMAHPRYRGVKAIIAIILGPLLGVSLATVGHWTMLASAGLPNVPPRLDVFVTGLVLGTSSLPAHAAITNIGDLLGRIGGSSGDKKN